MSCDMLVTLLLCGVLSEEFVIKRYGIGAGGKFEVAAYTCNNGDKCVATGVTEFAAGQE